MSEPVRIALPDFVTADPSEAELAHSLSLTIASDLKQSRIFELVDPEAFPRKHVDIEAPPELIDWRRSRTEELVAGRITRQSDGRVKVEFRLWEISSDGQLAGQQYIGNAGDISGIGHMISGEIYQSATRERRAFE